MFATFRLSRLICIVIHPLVVVYLVLFCVTCSLFPELTIKDQLKKAITGTMDGITYSVVDSMVRSILFKYLLPFKTVKFLLHNFRSTVTGCSIWWRWSLYPRGLCCGV